jgi:YidC/Oxa1 family membrane protein insertase
MLFTIVIKMAMLPLTIKQQKTMMKMSKLTPKLNAIKEKYGDDKQKMATEQQRVYNENKVTPLGGCLPLILQLVIIYPIFQVVNRPLTYILNMDVTAIDALKNQLTSLGISLEGAVSEAKLLDYAMSYGIEGIRHINFNFLGMNMATSPLEAFSVSPISLYWLIPIFAVLTAWFSQRLSMQTQKALQAEAADEQGKKKSKKEKNKTDGENKDKKDLPNPDAMQGTMKIMPAVSGLFTLQFSTGVGIYWVISNIMQGLQQLYMNKKFGIKTSVFKKREKSSP